MGSKPIVTMNTEEFINYLYENDFVHYSFSEYGGSSGLIDYAPNGVKVLKKITEQFDKLFDDLGFKEIKASALAPAQVFEKSGHLANFKDTFYDCEGCGKVFKDSNVCPSCSTIGSVNNTRNLMMKIENTNLYLRPETTASFFNFFRKYLVHKKEVPLGLYQKGTSFRNEISPRKGLLRLKEFNQYEAIYVYKSSTTNRKIRSFDEEDEEEATYRCYLEDKGSEQLLNTTELFLKIKENSLVRFAASVFNLLEYMGFKKEELVLWICSKVAHYSEKTIDIYWTKGEDRVELLGISKRKNSEIANHCPNFPKDLLSELRVLEVSVGLDRVFYTLLKSNLETSNDGRYKLQLNSRIAPYPIVFLPLVQSDELVEYAKKLHRNYSCRVPCAYFEHRSIGKRYTISDKLGIPYAVTIDYETIESGTVTIRDLRTREQKRINAHEIIRYLI